MTANGASILEIIAYLRSSETFRLTPMTFLVIIQDALGISFVKTRELYEYLDPDLRPLSEEAARKISELGDRLLRDHRNLEAL